MMGIEEKELREGFERWVDERIHAAISSLSSPLDKRIHALKRRVEGLRERFQVLSQRLERSTAGAGEGRPVRKQGDEVPR